MSALLASNPREESSATHDGARRDAAHEIPIWNSQMHLVKQACLSALPRQSKLPWQSHPPSVSFSTGEMSEMGPGCVKTCTRKECAELFSPFSLSTVTASTVLFLFNVIETKFLRASPTWEFSHSLGHLRPKSTTQVTSAAPSRAEIQRTSLVVRFVPQADAARGCPARHPESGPRNMP